MTIKELEKESETYAAYVSMAYMHMYAIDKRPIAEGYIQGYARALQQVVNAVDSNSGGYDCNVNLACLVGHDNLELLEEFKKQGNL